MHLTNLFIEIDVIVVEEMYKVLDSRDRWVGSASQALVCLALLTATDKALHLDDLLHVFLVELLLLCKFLADQQASC